MKTSIRIANQRGVALVLALLLLFVLITIGVAGFGNTHLQERSASNARLQAEAFKAASAGAANAINFFVANRDRDDIGIEDADCGATNHAGWYDSTDPTIAVPTDWVKPTEWPAASAASDNIGQAVLSQRMYCLADAYPCGAEDEELGFDCSVTARPPRSQLFVVSRGQVIVDEKVVASRDIEVRVARARDGTPGDGCGAICFPACG